MQKHQCWVENSTLFFGDYQKGKKYIKINDGNVRHDTSFKLFYFNGV